MCWRSTRPRLFGDSGVNRGTTLGIPAHTSDATSVDLSLQYGDDRVAWYCRHHLGRRRALCTHPEIAPGPDVGRRHSRPTQYAGRRLRFMTARIRMLSGLTV